MEFIHTMNLLKTALLRTGPTPLLMLVGEHFEVGRRLTAAATNFVWYLLSDRGALDTYRRFGRLTGQPAALAAGGTGR